MNNAISISCDRNNLKRVREFVKNNLSAYPLSDIVLNQMVLAVDEICANLIIHANAEDKSKFLHLSISRDKEYFLFEIVDSGKSFEHAKYQEPNILQHIKEGKKGGVGIALVRRIMDKVEFSSNGKKNVCRLYKKVPIKAESAE
jgi:serine/threonine-protein kinase RsbW